MIQAAMGWQNCHLHAFAFGGEEYGVPHPDLDHRDERRVTLADAGGRPGDRARYTYTYDFGDGWDHDLVVEEAGVAEIGGCYPACVAGEGRCPPEDCGGVWGYENLRAVLADPHHEEHDEMLAWMGLEHPSAFDPHHFDVDEANRALRRTVAMGATLR